MPIAEFTRAFYAMNRVLEDASYKVRLSKRAAVVLLILFETDDGRMKTADLVRTLQTWNVSTGSTVSKDVSIAKHELFDRDLVMARGGIRNVELTDLGRQRALELVGAIGEALHKLVTNQDSTSLLRRVSESVEIPKKPVNSAELKRLAKGKTS